ncbi:MAG TPA: RHS repeat-associated core domain-containing protein [Anaerolineales bacterium]|nr:RHS repeat-associated core domain-containing protein [Anaerolineales bacterium]
MGRLHPNTGQQTDSYSGLQYLRARYYDPSISEFTSRDTWSGDVNNPLSFNHWAYTDDNPVNLTDPSGKFPDWCQSMADKASYERCVDLYYKILPISLFNFGDQVQGSQGCYIGPLNYRAPGYLEGVGFWALIHRFGWETVYDFASMERANFTYHGGGVNTSLDLGAGAQVYVGGVLGFRTDRPLIDAYRGVSSSIQAGIGAVGISGGGIGFISWSDPMVSGADVYIGGSLEAAISDGDLVSGDVLPTTFYFGNNSRSYKRSDGSIDIGGLMSDIWQGRDTPILGTDVYSPYQLQTVRAFGAMMGLYYAEVYTEINDEISDK